MKNNRLLFAIAAVCVMASAISNFAQAQTPSGGRACAGEAFDRDFGTRREQGWLRQCERRQSNAVRLSLGGNAIGELAATHPEQVEKVILIDSGINGFQNPTPNVLQRIPTYLELTICRGAKLR